MKKYLFNIFVLVLATMVGCQKSEVEGVLEESNNSANKITVTADIANDGQTRVALTPDTDGEGKPIVKVDWRTSGVKEKFDVFSLLGSSTPTMFEQIEGNQFSGNNIFNDDEMYIATYPSGIYSLTSTFIYDKMIFTSQNGQLSEDKTLMVSDIVYALNEYTKFSFIHSTALLMPKFRIQGATVNLSPAEIQTITLKSMSIDGGTADFNIDCTGHGAEDDIYVYLPTYDYEIVGIDKIEVVVTTRDAKIYDGEINIGGTTLYAGKLYTANIWLTQKVFTNVITYTTTDNSKHTFGQYDGLQESMFESHIFENGIGKITLKNDITSIPSYGITNSRIKSLVLPSAITRLEAMAIGQNTDLTSVDLTYITEIGSQAFASCSNLSQITMPQGDFTIGDNAFVDCGLTVIDLSNATSIGHYAFNTNVNLTTVIVNRDTPATVGMRVFDICNALENIYVPASAVSAYQSAWSDYADKIKPISEMAQ
ncbi:MAG: leucine-rich repeat domain-containing protein [Alistipes sp.]|nr:leucine-rich repeat domain-containing protein [Alistipes sp.]